MNTPLQKKLTEKDVPILARRILYLFLSGITCDPHLDKVELLFDENFREDVRNAAYLAAEQAPGDSFELGPGERPPRELSVDSLFEEIDRGREHMKEEYTRVFGHTLSKDVPPCAVEYCDRTDVFYRSQRLADLNGFYRAFDVEPSNHWTDREDHLSLQAEFLSLLLQKQLYGRTHDHDPEQLELTQKAERDFFEEHMAWWLPSFAENLREQAGTGLYRHVADFLASFVPLERAYFDLDPSEEIPEPEVIEYEPNDGCGTCGGVAGVTAGKPSMKNPENGPPFPEPPEHTSDSTDA